MWYITNVHWSYIDGLLPHKSLKKKKKRLWDWVSLQTHRVCFENKFCVFTNSLILTAFNVSVTGELPSPLHFREPHIFTSLNWIACITVWDIGLVISGERHWKLCRPNWEIVSFYGRIAWCVFPPLYGIAPLCNRPFAIYPIIVISQNSHWRQCGEFYMLLPRQGMVVGVVVKGVTEPRCGGLAWFPWSRTPGIHVLPMW